MSEYNVTTTTYTYPEIMDIVGASNYIGVHRDTMYKYVKEDKVPYFKVGNRYRFKKSVLDSWIEEQIKKEKVWVRK